VRYLALGAMAAGLLWAFGLGAFIKAVPKSDAAILEGADGVVVYTGGGGARIAAAMLIFGQGAGRRLLISGVNPGTSKERLSELWAGAPDLFECCVDLGREALTTEGNAFEAAQWARSHQFQHLVLVTSDYHMPRAVAVTKARMRDVEITPYPVSSGYLNEDGWPASLDAWRKIAGEYSKYVLSRAKAFFMSFGR
jgi:uncharacterized SAM-binding protein YcdF (DUF218 family)